MWTLQEVSVVRQLTFDSLADELPTLRAFVDALLSVTLLSLVFLSNWKRYK